MKTVVTLLFLLVSFNVSAQANSERSKKIKIFPNPATHVINVLGIENENSAHIFISDSYGNIVIKHTWAIKNNSLNIPVFHLDQGVYLLTIKTEHQQIQQKFLKQ